MSDYLSPYMRRFETLSAHRAMRRFWTLSNHSDLNHDYRDDGLKGVGVPWDRHLNPEAAGYLVIIAVSTKTIVAIIMVRVLFEEVSCR